MRMLRFAAGCSLLFAAFNFVVLAQTCPGSSGCPDTDFGIGGEFIVTSPANQSARQMLLQSDRKIVWLIGVNTANTVAGYLIRMDPDAKQYDSTFGSGGIVTLTWGGASGRVQGIGIQIIDGEERVVVAGWAPCGKKFCTRVERYTSAGILDGSFGNSGVSITSTSDASPHMVTILPDQRILLIRGVLGMTRLTENGNLDLSFGSNGTSTATSAMYQVRGPAVILSDGRFLIPGTMSMKGNRDLAVGRFNSNGSLDSGGRGDSTPSDAFGSGGFATLHLSSTPCFGNDLLVEESGKIIVAGVRGSLPAFTVRFTANGQIDSTYPINSLVGLTASYFSEMVFQGDGKIVVAGQGQSVDGIPQDALISRYNADGTVDTTFGNNGWILKDYYGVYNWAQSVLMQPDPACSGCEKILVNGGANISSSPVNQDINFSRYLR